MKSNRHVLHSVKAVLSLLILAALLFIGCSQNDSPTAPTPEPNGENLWNPQPGDQLVPGRDVPILAEEYWTSQGQQINPLRGLLGNLLQPVFQLIGLLGGTVQLNLHSYTIPAGAVNVPGVFTLAYASINGVGVDCGPSPYAFNLPVTLTLSFSGTQYANWQQNGLDPTQLQIFYSAPNGTLTALPSTVNVAAMTVTAHVDHFSRYILG